MDYFPHDARAMGDDKLLALRIKSGLEAVACYWAVIEKIYADEGPFDVSETNVEATSVLLRLGVGFETLEKHVSTMVEIGLLERDVENPSLVMSARAREYIGELERKRETARQNGRKGGRKPSSGKRRNQGETKVGSKVGSDVGADVAPHKTLNGIGLHKANQIPGAAPAADAGGPAPGAAPECARCAVPMQATNTYTTGKRRRIFRCPLCGDEAEVGQ